MDRVRLFKGLAHACGLGLRREAKDPELKSFLQLQQASLACEHTKEASATDALNGFQAAHRYLLLTLGEAWRHWGVDWRVADSLALGLYALSCTMGFLLLRVFLPLAWSLAGTWLFASAGSHLFYLDSLRDYAKAPFVLAVMIGLAWLLKERHPPRQRLLVALLTGCALGVGLGFRMDLLIFVPFVAAMLCFFYPAPLREAWGERLLATGVLLLAAFACAFPVLTAMAKGANTAHVILLGLSQPFSEALRVGSQDYQFSAYYHDMFQLVQVERFAQLRGFGERLELATSAYEQQGYRLLLEWAMYFPADLFWRVVAAVVQGLGFAHDLAFDLSGGRALVIVALGMAVIGWRSARLGGAFLLAVLFLFAYPALQFSARHFFFLSIVTVLCAGLVVHALVLGLWGMRSSRQPLPSRRVKTFLSAGAAVLCAPALVWGLLWLVQRPMQGELLQAAKALPVHWVREGGAVSSGTAPNLLSTNDLGKWWSQRSARYPYTREDSERMGYFWVVDLDPERQDCGGQAFYAALSYRASSAYYDLSRPVSLKPTQRVRLFIPAVEMKSQVGPLRNSASVVSLLVNDRSWPCVERIGVAEPSADFPWLLEVAVPLGPGHDRLRPALPYALWPAPTRHWTIAAAPSQDAAARLYLADARLEPLALGQADVHAGAAVALTASGLLMDAPAADRHSYLIRTDGIGLNSGDVLRVSGVLETGGLTVGLVKDAAWAHQLRVLQPGAFELFFSPEGGDYHLVIANHVDRPGERNAFEVQRIGRVTAPPH